MKKYIVRILFLLLPVLSVAQGVAPFKGAVVQVRPVPSPTGVVSMNFLLYGELVAGTNYFSYDDSQFYLAYTGSPFCEGTCTFTTTEKPSWFYPQSLGKFCTIQSGTLVGTLEVGGHNQPDGKYVQSMTYQSVPSEYSQVFCQDHGNWSSGGTLQIHIQQ